MAIALALGFAFWALAGANRDAGRFPASSRYQYPSAVFLLLIAAEALRGVRLPARARAPALAAAAILLVLAVVGGVSLLEREYEQRWRPAADSLRSTLAAVELAGPAARPGYRIAFAPAPTASAGAYLEAVDRYGGSPAWSEATLAARPAGERRGADLVLAQVEELRLTPPIRARDRGCRALTPGAGLPLGPGAHTVANRTRLPVEILLARFAPGASVDLGPLPAGERALLEIPHDASPRRWRISPGGAGSVRLCSAVDPGRSPVEPGQM